MSEEALQWKAKGNEAFSAKDFKTAIEHFSKAIELDGSNHVLYSNRSASYASLQNFQAAKDDAAKCVSLKPDWAKGYVRLGAAQHGLEDFDEAIKTYEDGLRIDGANESLQSGLADVKAAKGRVSNPFAKIFGPDCLGKIASNPQLQPFLAQPDYLQMIQTVQANPEMINMYIKDQRMMQTFMALSGIDLKGAGAGAGDDDGPAPAAAAPSRPAPTSTSSSSTTSAPPKKKEEPKSEAQLIKEEGNAHYKKREFDEAMAKYKKASELEPNNTIFLLNQTAVIFEQGKFDECITECEKAIEHAKENKTETSYQTIVKLMTRKASCLQKKGEYDEAITLFKSALLEWRNPDTLNKLDACQKEKKQKAAEAYINPELAKEHKEKGNALFKEQKFPEAEKEYSESIKRDPKEHTTYSNRAACYLKLGAYDDAVKDCDKAIEIKPDFVRAHYRKGNAYFFRKQYNMALQAYDAGLKIDPENEECKEGKQKTVYKIQEVATGQGDEGDQEEVAKRAMADPEIQSIMQDSYMQLVLSEMQKDPRKLNDYMQDPGIAAKINKLVASGILRMGGGPAPAQGQRR